MGSTSMACQCVGKHLNIELPLPYMVRHLLTYLVSPTTGANSKKINPWCCSLNFGPPCTHLPTNSSGSLGLKMLFLTRWQLEGVAVVAIGRGQEQVQSMGGEGRGGAVKSVQESQLEIMSLIVGRCRDGLFQFWSRGFREAGMLSLLIPLLRAVLCCKGRKANLGVTHPGDV